MKKVEQNKGDRDSIMGGVVVRVGFMKKVLFE